MESTVTDAAATASARGDQQKKSGDLDGAIASYLDAAAQLERVTAPLCLGLARAYLAKGNYAEAIRWAASVVDAGDDYGAWMSAAALIAGAGQWNAARVRRRARVALAASFTTSQLRALLPLAALRHGIDLQVWEGQFGQYRQDLLDGTSALYQSAPDFIVLAVHERDLALPALSGDPEADVAREVSRWTSLWYAVARHSAARVIQMNFALTAEAPLGHLGARLRESRYAMTQMVNSRLGMAAGNRVGMLDCERLSSLVGKSRWFDSRYWHFSRQAISLQFLPLVDRHLTAVLAADLGLNRKCLVLDLDNTLWGGVIGEDGLSGIKLGGDATGEAFSAFQEYILRLKDKGVILAVCSKNDDAIAREPFERHPDTKLRLDDFAAFVANWEPKPANIERIAKSLNISLDALVFVDDNPAECEAIRRALPEVDVIELPADPSAFVRELSEYLMFETSSLTDEDLHRTAQYRARSAASAAEQTAASIEELWDSLKMTATAAPFDEMTLPRIVQLIGKTNQFNLTTRRHGRAQVEAFMNDPECVHFSVRLSDRYTDHGLVGLMIAFQRGSVLDIDTWLMSCRVIGRSLENTMVAHLCDVAAQRGVTTLRGFFAPTPKNALVSGLFARLGFARVGEGDASEAWEYDLAVSGSIENRFITLNVAGDRRERASAAGAGLQGCVQ